MAEPDSSQALVTFNDVAVYFSEEEWQRLEEWQKELYKIVLKEIHEALISLGYAIANPDVIFRIKKEREPCIKYRPCLEGGPIPKPDVLLRVKQEENSYSSDPNNSEESITITSTDHPDVASVFTLSLKHEENQYYIQDQDLAAVESIVSPTNDKPITQYRDWYYGGVMEGYNETQEQLKQFTKNVKVDGVKLSNDEKVSNRGHNAAFKQKPPLKHEPDESKDSDSEDREGDQSWEKARKRSQLKKNSSKKTEFNNTVVSPGAVEYFSCPECLKCFNKKSNLIRHRTTHTGDRPYQCNLCDKNFNKKSNLIRHQRTHSTERVFKCCECESKFDRLADLHKHQKTHVGDQAYACNDCKKMFSRKSNLVRHQIQYHSLGDIKPKLEMLIQQDRTFVCNTCDKSFCQMSDLNTHLQTHSGDRPYSCNECNLTFNDKSNLLYHKCLTANKQSTMQNQNNYNVTQLQDSNASIL
ncbi:zinc finger protein 793-like isoform X3 [Ambystoma mexicanum]|uniref:zinc finger protein 793-like isoform X3 n=1 Tax=Ambystoma mexicanum TaxID=8296 RepID=UPI0037E7E4CD